MLVALLLEKDARSGLRDGLEPLDEDAVQEGSQALVLRGRHQL